MSNVLFLSIQTSLLPPFRYGMDDLYERAGANLGNLLFTNAVWRQIAWTNAQQAFYFDPAYANEYFDCVVIPAANWLYAGFDMSEIAVRVEKLRIPVVMIGLGAQADTNTGIPNVSESGLRLVRAVAERSALIGARGEFTADVLSHYGVKNVQIIGCPSLYFNTCTQREITKSHDPKRILLAGTRYYLDDEEMTEAARLQQQLFRLAFHHSVDLLFQSERPELDYLIVGERFSIEPTDTARALEYYGIDNAEALLRFLGSHGRCYLDVDQWLASMRNYDLFAGTRIHGAIAAHLAGTPAILFTHDTRTNELADFAHIPSFPLSDFDGLTLNDIERIYAETSWEKHFRRMKFARQEYKAFLETNGLDHWIEN